MKTNNNGFEEKSEYERKLIEFTRAVNDKSDHLKKVDSDAISTEPENVPDKKSNQSSETFAYKLGLA